MFQIKSYIRHFARNCGFDIVRYHRGRMGLDPFADIHYLLEGISRPLIFDIGGNVGQTVDTFKSWYPDSVIHTFEPSPHVFERLKINCKKFTGVNTWNLGIGSSNTSLLLQENEFSGMSSFLQPSEFSWGNIVRTTSVEVRTLDLFAREHNIDFIHVLKSDTQGYDYEVLKGASGLMEENRIGMVYFEFIFSDMYKNLPSFHDVFYYLLEQNFLLVTFYDSHFQKDLISWTDALFINREFNQRRQINRT